jgi:hypothetical protein
MYWSEVPVHPTKQVYSVVVDYLAMPSVSWMRSAWWELTWTNSQHGRGEQMSLLMAGPSATTGLQVLASLPANGMSHAAAAAAATAAAPSATSATVAATSHVAVATSSKRTTSSSIIM